jgi:hypothetical protein
VASLLSDNTRTLLDEGRHHAINSVHGKVDEQRPILWPTMLQQLQEKRQEAAE